jgi:hypothetical protein
MQFGMGHDGINHWICTRFRATRLGFYGVCVHCDGEGATYRDEAHRAAAEAWAPTEPPAGEGWQMWETTSEGSPISPVMPTPELLAGWLVRNNASAFGGEGASYVAWMGMIKAGWAPSAVGGSSGIVSGVEAAVEVIKPVFSVYPLKTAAIPETVYIAEYDAYHDPIEINLDPTHAFEALFPNSDMTSPAVVEFLAWLKDRGIKTQRRMQVRSDFVVGGDLGASAAFEFKTRWR